MSSSKSKSNDDKIVLNYGDSLLRERDVALLSSPNSWLNDVLISFYFEYVADQRNTKVNSNRNETVTLVNCCTAQCIKLCGGAEHLLEPLRNENTRFMILPVNDCDSLTFDETQGGNHWSFVVLDLKEKHLYHFDSMGTSNTPSADLLKENLRGMFWNNDRHDCIIEFTNVKALQQNNGYDCGIHVLCNVDLVLKHIDKTGKVEGCDILHQSSVDKKRGDLLALIYKLKTISHSGSTN